MLRVSTMERHLYRSHVLTPMPSSFPRLCRDERRNSKFPSRAKHYKHEDEEAAPDNAIDFSKLSIQDIIYIKSLMGERRPNKKKRQIYVA